MPANTANESLPKRASSLAPSVDAPLAPNAATARSGSDKESEQLDSPSLVGASGPNEGTSNENQGSVSTVAPGFNFRTAETTLTKVFVGGLAWQTKSETLQKHFAQYGDILEAVVIMDKTTGRSKGFGFVTFSEQEAAQRATANANPIIDSRRANCNLAALGANRHRSAGMPTSRFPAPFQQSHYETSENNGALLSSMQPYYYNPTFIGYDANQQPVYSYMSAVPPSPLLSPAPYYYSPSMTPSSFGGFTPSMVSVPISPGMTLPLGTIQQGPPPLSLPQLHPLIPHTEGVDTLHLAKREISEGSSVNASANGEHSQAPFETQDKGATTSSGRMMPSSSRFPLANNGPLNSRDSSGSIPHMEGENLLGTNNSVSHLPDHAMYHRDRSSMGFTQRSSVPMTQRVGAPAVLPATNHGAATTTGAGAMHSSASFVPMMTPMFLPVQVPPINRHTGPRGNRRGGYEDGFVGRFQRMTIQENDANPE